jgi:hypothetical protein
MPNFYIDSIRYPKVVKSILLSTIDYNAQNLYKSLYEQDITSALQRYILSDLGAGNEFNHRDATRTFESINFPYPFTVYTIEENEIRENLVQKVSRRYMYSPILNRYVSAYPAKFKIKFITFFDTPDDMLRAQTLLFFDNASLTRLYAPLKFVDFTTNTNKTITTPFDLQWEVTQGTYAFAFENYLKQNNIYDVQHTATILYYDYTLSEDVTNLTVDEFIFSVANGNTLATEDTLVIKNPAGLEYNLNTSIAEGQIGVPITTTSITFEVSLESNELAFEDNFVISPTIHHSFEWNSDSTRVIVRLLEPLEINTAYTIDYVLESYGGAYKISDKLNFVSGVL